MIKLTADQRRDLMEVIDDRHDRGSTIVATQIPQDCLAPSRIGDPTYARRDPGSPRQTTRIASNSRGKSMRGNSARRAVAESGLWMKIGRTKVNRLV